MEVHEYNMLVQNHVHYNYVVQKITLWGGGAMVKDLIIECEGKEFKSTHLRPKLLKWPN
jgi:hypothetical protein